MSDWTQVGENLVRHEGGTIYLRAKVSGKVIRVSLETEDLRIAKMKRDARLSAIRKKSVAARSTDEKVVTLGDALRVVKTRILVQPHLEETTVGFYKEITKATGKRLPLDQMAAKWQAMEAAKVWKVIAQAYESQRANHMLGVMKQIGKLLVELGVRMDDPTTKLRRVKIVKVDRAIPSRDQIDQVIAAIRTMKKAKSQEAANYVAFLAFAGCRHGQAKALRWENISQDWIEFPSGISGTKGAETRQLPISASMRSLLEGMRYPDAKGLVFSMASPKEALKNACVRLKIPHLRIHDLRHYFATYAIEKGVDIPTIAKWVGHLDGGELLMKTYGHIRPDHSLESAKKLG